MEALVTAVLCLLILSIAFIMLAMIVLEAPQKLARKYHSWYIAHGWKLCKHKAKGNLAKCWPHMYKLQLKCKNCPQAMNWKGFNNEIHQETSSD